MYYSIWDIKSDHLVELLGKDTLKEIWKRPYLKNIVHEWIA